jgi:pimeloyl-ACP methyl ester carboxylesterase
MGSLYLKEIGGSIRWIDFGEGDPIVFLPGLSLPVATSFAAVAADPALANRRKILVDYPGSGFSDHPTNFDYSLASHANAIERVVDELELAEFDLVGHSMGGTVGIQYAIQNPNRLTHLMVGEGNLTSGGGAMSLRVAGNGKEAFLNRGYAQLIETLAQKGRDGAAGPDRLAAGWRIADPAGIFGNADALINLPDGFFDQFGELPIAKSFVYGEEGFKDTPTPDAPDPTELEMRNIVPYVVPKAGHSMHLDNHQGFMEVLAKALAQ